MAKKSGRGGYRPGSGRLPQPDKRDDATAKIDRKLLAKAKYVVEMRGGSIAEYLSEILRPHVEQDFEVEIKKGQP